MSKHRGVVVMLVVRGFETPVDAEEILNASHDLVEPLTELGGRPGIAIVRAAVCHQEVSKEDLADALLMLGQMVAETACAKMEEDFGWPDQFKAMMLREMFNDLEPGDTEH
jgi:hypothetical protein